MNVLEFTLVVWLGSIAAGFLGALTGLGGGVIIVPLLTTVLGVDMHYAIGASLIGVIATSSGAAAAYVKEGFTNIRIGMFLEVATILGALVGAHLAGLLPADALGVAFGGVLLTSACLSGGVHPETPAEGSGDPIAEKLRLNGTFPTPDGPQTYHVRNVPGGFAMMVLAGLLSGLLGIGSGAFKVLAMDQIMRIPFKVSTTTSNFMIGVTAAASAGVYLARGYIAPGLAMPVMLGVVLGSLLGAKTLPKAKPKGLRLAFTLVIAALGVEMIYMGWTGKL